MFSSGRQINVGRELFRVSHSLANAMARTNVYASPRVFKRELFEALKQTISSRCFCSYAPSLFSFRDPWVRSLYARAQSSDNADDRLDGVVDYIKPTA